jgi:hypothetical protein
MRSFKLIRPKHFIIIGDVHMDLPQTGDLKHTLSMQVQKHADMKKSIVATILQFTYAIEIARLQTSLVNSLNFKNEKECKHKMALTRKNVFGKGFDVSLTNRYQVGSDDYFFNPSVSVSTALLSPLSFNVGYNF